MRDLKVNYDYIAFKIPPKTNHSKIYMSRNATKRELAQWTIQQCSSQSCTSRIIAILIFHTSN